MKPKKPLPKNETFAVKNEVSQPSRVLIKPGEKIPADGKIFEGKTSINESMLTLSLIHI